MEIKMDRKEWRKRFKYRMDLSSRITHLTKGGDEDEAFDNLINILEEKKNQGEYEEKWVYMWRNPSSLFARCASFGDCRKFTI